MIFRRHVHIEVEGVWYQRPRFRWGRFIWYSEGKMRRAP
jgi:hypothetical protein